MKINKDEFLQALDKVVPGLAKKEIVKEMNYIVSEAGRLYSYNDKLAISVQFDTGVDFVVHGKNLYEAIKKSRAKNIEFEIEDDVLVCTIGKVVNEIPLLKDDLIIKTHAHLNYEEVTYVPLAEDFVKGLELCATCASKNLNNLYGLYSIRITDQDIFATDQVRMLLYEVETDINTTIFVPAEQVKTIKAFQPIGIAEDFVSKNWVFFKNENEDVLGIKLFDVSKKFVSEERIYSFFDLPEDLPYFKLPKEIANDLAVVSVFSDEETENVNVNISKEGELSIVSESVKGFSELYDEIPDYKGEEITFDINPTLLLEMLKHSAKVLVSDYFICVQEENLTYLLAQMNK